MHPSISWSQIVPNLSSLGRDLLQKLLVCNPAGRMDSESALKHPYFSTIEN